MTRAGLHARLRRLEHPRRGKDALRRELEKLEREHPLVEPDFARMTDDELDAFFLESRDDRSPQSRILYLREALKTPAERAEDARQKAMFDAMTDQELDTWLEGRLAVCQER